MAYPIRAPGLTLPALPSDLKCMVQAAQAAAAVLAVQAAAVQVTQAAQVIQAAQATAVQVHQAAQAAVPEHQAAQVHRAVQVAAQAAAVQVLRVHQPVAAQELCTKETLNKSPVRPKIVEGCSITN